MNGKTVIVTGASGGIGKETVRTLMAKRGARVILAVRNTEVGTQIRDLLKKTAPSRVVVVSSSFYRLRSLDLNNINPDSSWCVPTIYHLSKHANISFTLELARRLEGSGVTANCLHPGMIDSGIWRNLPEPFKWPLKFIITTLSRTPEQGSQTTVFLSCSEEVKTVTGKYFVDCKETSLSSAAMDMSKAKKFWELSEKFVKI